MIEVKEQGSERSVASEEQHGEGIELPGSRETIPPGTEFQRDLEFRHKVAEDFEPMLRDIKNTRERSLALNKLVEQRKKELEAQNGREPRKFESLRDEVRHTYRRELEEYKRQGHYSAEIEGLLDKFVETEKKRRAQQRKEAPAEGEMSEKEQLEFSAWVTEKMNAGAGLPDAAAERLQMYRDETDQKEEVA